MEAETWAEIKRLWQVDKFSIAEIARRVHMDRKTIRRAIRSDKLPVTRLFQARPSILDPFKGYVQERIQKYPHLCAPVILREIKQQGYPGKIRILNEYILTLRRRAKEVFLRIETSPGEQAQVDWADCGSVTIGHALRKLSCFVMVLSYSRMMYLEFRLSQCLEDFIQCHINAFQYFTGLTRKILYDNLKLVVLSRLGTEIRFNPKFMEFAGIFGFEPVLCNIARGNEKGKVESGIGYIRTNLLAGRNISWPKIREEGRQWLDQTANVRIHRTTQKRPLDLWELEKPFLLPLPQGKYDASIIRPVRSTHQALAHFDGNVYSVPHQYAYQTLLLRATEETVRIVSEGKEIASHERSYDRGAVIENPKHFEGILAIKRKAFASRLQRSYLDLGPVAGDYLDGLAYTQAHLSKHIAQIMELVATYGKEEVLSAMTHALEFKAFAAGYIQNIILQKRQSKGLREILPITIPQKPSWNEIITEEPDLSIYDKLMGDSEGPASAAKT